MTSPIDIYQTANELIKQHGNDAPIHAAMRADELLEAGDMDVQGVWKRILAAVDELMSEEWRGSWGVWRRFIGLLRGRDSDAAIASDVSLTRLILE